MSIPFFPRLHDRQLRDLLMAHADMLIAGRADHARLPGSLDSGSQGEVADLLRLAERLNRTLTEVAPSERFVDQLGRALALADAPAPLSLWQRVRHLPPRTRWAAGIGGATLTAGVVIIASRSLPDALGYLRNRRTLMA